MHHAVGSGSGAVFLKAAYMVEHFSRQFFPALSLVVFKTGFFDPPIARLS